MWRLPRPAAQCTIMASSLDRASVLVALRRHPPLTMHDHTPPLYRSSPVGRGRPSLLCSHGSLQRARLVLHTCYIAPLSTRPPGCACSFTPPGLPTPESPASPTLPLPQPPPPRSLPACSTTQLHVHPLRPMRLLGLAPVLPRLLDQDQRLLHREGGHADRLGQGSIPAATPLWRARRGCRVV